MSQETNLNVSPYFDDFDANNDYYKVLFKPGYPIQSRELTTLQSILQNQIEKFGQAFFKEGAKVIPGNTGYNALYYCVQLNSTYLGVPVEAYVDQIVGTKITGQTSGVTAVVEKVLLSRDSERGNTTLYINYIGSSTQNNSSQQFLDGETLITTATISSGLLGNTTIAAGQPFANTIANGACATGSSFSISNGVYFIRGQFIAVNDEIIILDQYGNKPNYRVGLYVNEEIVNSDIDETLNDNSQGFNNYAAPGADRLKISVSLYKKSLTDFNDNGFVELATIKEGVVRSQQKSAGGAAGGVAYQDWTDILARRTYAESGDYYVNPFDISLKESLNDNQGNRGIFNEGQFTYGGSTPTDDLAIYQVSPGRAFIRGYDIETISPTFLDVAKPRTTATLENQAINYNTGPTFKLNRVFGSPTVGIGNTYVLSLRDSRAGTSQTTAPGKEIGVARVYDFKLESGSYSNSNSNINEWNIALYDVQTVTEITLNEPITLNVPAIIKGNSSGATAFLKSSVSSSNLISVYEKKGDFILNESFTVNGISNGRVATAITSYGLSDVKSVFGQVGTAATFSADTVQSSSFIVGIASISPVSGGISTVKSTNLTFPTNIKVGNIVRYSDVTSVDPIYASVAGVGTNFITVSGITTVTGICNNRLPSSFLSVVDFTVLNTSLEASTDNTLYTRLPKNNVSNVDLTDASITIRKSYTVNISSNRLSTAIDAGANQTFLPFDAERYSLIRSDGTTEVLTSDKFSFTNASSTLQIYNLGSNDSGATLLTTIKKIKPKAKVKRKNRVNSIVIDKSKYEGSGIGATTFDDGLVYGNYPYGTRVQDEEVSLNVSDIIEVYGIFEAIDSSTTPSAPTMVIAASGGAVTQTTDLIIGEKFVGQSSGATAIVAERIENSKISFLYKNGNLFREGETIIFEESKAQATITTLDTPSYDVSLNFSFTNGQESTFYDYGVIKRKVSSQEPVRKIKVYFSNGFYESTDDGDITTVNSYSQFSYGRDIQTVNGVRNSDILDIRPKTSDYTVSEGSRSPLEFYGRTFNSSGNSAANILASDESIITTFSYYLGRIDRIYLSKDGSFQVKYGTPSDRPEKPVSVDDSLEIATITLPPYLYNVSQASIQFLNHKRYRMADIKNLEDRIKSLEYYTTLSLLETNTSNLFIPDGEGLNRFKSGFFVDNFTSLLAQEESVEYKNSIDIENKELRPQHYTTSIDLITGPVEGVDPTADLAFEDIEGINVRKTGDVITLDYSEVEWLKQSFATRAESVTPFLISFWQGTLELTPSTDTWVDTVRLEAKIIQTEGNYAETLSNAVKTLNVDPQTGFAPVVWNAWQTNWTGQEIVRGTRERTVVSGGEWRGGGGWIAQVDTQTTTVFRDDLLEIRDTGVQTRTGNRTIITEQFDQTSVGDRVVNRSIVPYMRSRNIQFITKKVKPLTRLYAFFDGVNVSKYCVPKLLEISMVSGVFEVGETVVGTVSNIGLGDNIRADIPGITFRVAQSNHREGPYNAASLTFPQNPYTGQTLQGTYSSTSNILNIDTFSLANQPQGSFSGWVESGMKLVGRTSGAQAVITNVRLVSDIGANLYGNLFIPNPNNNAHPKFEVGTKTLTFVNNDQNDQNNATTIAEEGFTSSGTLETVQENIISVRNARIQNKQEFEDRAVSRTTGTQVVGSTVLSQSRRDVVVGWYDPLAQSFLVDNSTGIFLTRCDVFFRTKDDMDIPVTFQLRTMENGFPTQKILPFSEITLDPEQVTTSADGSVSTSFNFSAPVYLEGGKEYAICLASNSTKYSVYVSRIGENDLLTQTYISNQPYLGSLFKSQNASTWEASQWEDLKFTLYRAEFATSGTVEFYNPQLTEGNSQIANLLSNPLNLSSRKIRVSTSIGVTDSQLKIGNTISQLGTNGTGNYVGSAGSATATLNIINAGIGYTPASGVLQFNNVNLTSITGNGSGATANITISNGVAVAATISGGGSGYIAGDVLGITSIGNLNVGANARFSLVSIAGTNQIILDNVQGDFEVGVGKTLQYTNISGISTGINGFSGNVLANSIAVVTDGTHIKVNHRNHGMYSDLNLVNISGVKPDTRPTKLVLPISYDSTSGITVDDIAGFSTFEKVGVGSTNPGYALVGDEVISYTSVSGSIIGGTIVRGINGVNEDHPAGTPVYKYELGSISLRRINITHNLQDVTVSDPLLFDSYNIKLDMSSNGIDRSSSTGFPTLYVDQTKSTGGSQVYASQNIPFEIITPLVQNLTVKGTSVSGEIRTITGKSINGNEIPFIDNGYQAISLNQSNYLDSTRLICSYVNEQDKLNNFVGNKSFNMRLLLDTTDTMLSPVIDTQRVSAIYTSNRVNNVISDIATDRRVNTISEDPTSFQYLSKEISLENSSTSIKVILSAHVNNYSDIRVLYAIGDKQNFTPIYVPFPGYANLDYRGRVINAKDNNGSSDTFVSPTQSLGFLSKDIEYKDYTFTVDNLPSFRNFRIKIIGTSSNQAYVPRFRDLRVIALA